MGISNVGVPPTVAAGKLISNCGTQLGSSPEGEAYNAVSASGRTVFFTSEACGGSPAVNEVYARIDASRTVAISEPLPPASGPVCTIPSPCATAKPSPGLFAGASLDGSRAFFLTSQPLVDGATEGGTDLYEAEIREGAVARLVQVSRGGTGDATPGSGANVLGVARISEDGSHVYFVAEGALTGANSEGNAPVTGQPNLYVAVSECPGGGTSCEDPAERISFVATLSRQDEEVWKPTDARPAQATAPDGRFLVFQSVADLTPDEQGLEAGQVFEYDAGTETLARVSRGENGYNDDGNSSVYPATIPVQFYLQSAPSAPENRFNALAVSADGSRVFFSSYDALTPQALNGANNVYEYHAGEISLISDGQDALDMEQQPTTHLYGTDESGRNVFFTTVDHLVPQAGDTQLDIYDARSEGGFPPAVEHAPCSGDACHGAVSAPPSLPGPLTSSVAAEANGPTLGTAVSAKPGAKTRAKAKKGKKGKKHKANRHKRRKTAGGR